MIVLSGFFKISTKKQMPGALTVYNPRLHVLCLLSSEHGMLIMGMHSILSVPHIVNGRFVKR